MHTPKATSNTQRRYVAALSAAAKSGPRHESGAPGASTRWWREARVYGMVFGIPLLILFPYTRFRPPAEFEASLHTRAVSFTVGQYDKAGLFVGGPSRVDVTFDGLSKVELPDTEQWKPKDGKNAGGDADHLWGGSVRFRDVDLNGLLMSPGTRVKMLWFEASPTGVSINLTYPGAPNAPSGQVFLDEVSAVEFSRSSVSEFGEPQNGSIRIPHDARGMASIYAGANRRLGVSITPCAAAASCVPGSVKPPSAAVGIPADAIAPAHQNTAALPPENNVPLSPGSTIAFLDNGSRESAILGNTNTVEVANADRKQTVLRGQRVEIAALATRPSGNPSEISFEIKDGITLNILGQAGELRIDGADARPSLAEYFQTNKVLADWLKTCGLLGGTILTILTRLKLFKSNGKEG